MSERLRNALSIGAIVVMAVSLVVLVATTPSDADRIEALGSRIMCPVCQGESIINSPSQLARDMMALVRERVEQGASDQEIIEEVLASYSGALLLDPPARGATLLLWLAPAAALVVGVGVIVWWRKHPAPLPASGGRSRGRTIVGGLILAGAFAATVVVAGFSLQDNDGPGAGVADLDGRDLSTVSNATMEAVIAANVDLPEINGMRLALAERYYQEGDYRSAFPHYLAVAESPQASDIQLVTALTRLGWMAYDGNQAVDTALELLDQALAIAPGSSATLYLKGRVLWCGAGDIQAATQVFQELLADEDLPEESRVSVSKDLEAVSRGESCA